MTPSRFGRSRQYLAALMIGAALSGGCTTFQPESPPPPIDISQPLFLTGRFSISYTESLPEPKTEHHSGRFLLKKDAQDLGIELYSPFGQTIVRAGQHQGEPAWLETPRHQRFTGQSLEDVLQQAIGIPVPADRLPDWLSDRFQTVLERSDDGSRIRARDRGWQIERTNHRWHLLWHQNTRRLDIRLVLDPVPAQAPTPGQ
ncbi:MAG: lipoprotein insertase outer membrane protein LolB [Lautropia sp.]|nr:lipoprotein insertase outer membrane protein LolB [Lautropia sp.]